MEKENKTMEINDITGIIIQESIKSIEILDQAY